MQRYAFGISQPDVDGIQEYRTAGEGLTAEGAVERCYEATPDGTEIVKVMRGTVPDGLDLSPPDSDDTSGDGEVGYEIEDEEGESDDELPLDPSEYTIPELEDKIRGYEDSQLQEILEAEEVGKNRDGARDAIIGEMKDV